MAKAGRPREFDDTVTPGDLTRVFWRRGYHETSIQDVVEETGVHRNSLYTAFGNKQALALIALDQYRSQVVGALDRLRQDDEIVPALRNFLMLPLDPHRAPDGCLLGNMTVEAARHDAEVRAAVTTGYEALESGLRAALERAHESGELPPGDAAAQAKLLMAVQQGLQVISQASPDRARLTGAVDAAIGSLY